MVSTWALARQHVGASGRQSQPSPPRRAFTTQTQPQPAFTAALGKGMARNACWVTDMNYPYGLLPNNLENPPALGQASGHGANTADCVTALCLLHSAQVRLWGLKDCKILEIKFVMECQLFVHSYAALKFTFALVWYGCHAMGRYNVQWYNEKVQCPTISFLICYTYSAVSFMAELTEKQKPEG